MKILKIGKSAKIDMHSLILANYAERLLQYTASHNVV